jgi:hypothetical protein
MYCNVDTFGCLPWFMIENQPLLFLCIGHSVCKDFGEPVTCLCDLSGHTSLCSRTKPAVEALCG